MSDSRRTQVFLHVTAGSVLVLAAIFGDVILGNPPQFGRWPAIALVAGLVILAMGFIPLGVITRVSQGLCLSLLSVVVVLALGEVCFRAIRYDFATSQIKAWREIPPYFRQPITPQGAVFFRRSGPERWTGQVLNTRLKQLGLRTNPYANEPTITVEYDRLGFRNPPGMTEWEIAIAGDSFTELGYLPYDALFTSILAKDLGVPVLNLGVSYTGPLSQLSYLQDYGISRTTKHTVITFFEGNDLDDLAAEWRDLERWQQTGKREYREFSAQPSLLRALYRRLTRVKKKRAHADESTIVTAMFHSAHGDLPITLTYTPPSRAQLKSETLDHLYDFFRSYAEFANDRQVTAWLAYMPCKRRVVHGQVEFSDSARQAIRSWEPTDLPEVISELCDRYGIKFIDLTPTLERETKATKELLYNSIYDTHLNARGSQVVAQELARHFSDAIPKRP